MREVLRAGRPVARIWLQAGPARGSLGEIAGLARERGVPVVEVPRAHLDRLTAGAVHQGVVAQVAAAPTWTWDRLEAHLTEVSEPFLLLLDRVQDPQNLGAILRVAEAAGADGVVIPQRGAPGLTGAVAKAAAGAAEWIPVARVANLAATVQALQRWGFFVFAAVPDGERAYFEVDWRGPVAVVIGGEGTGVRPLVVARCDGTVRIPMAGKVASLNAAAAAAVIAFEVRRQRGGLAAEGPGGMERRRAGAEESGGVPSKK